MFYQPHQAAVKFNTIDSQKFLGYCRHLRQDVLNQITDLDVTATANGKTISICKSESMYWLIPPVSWCAPGRHTIYWAQMDHRYTLLTRTNLFCSLIWCVCVCVCIYIYVYKMHLFDQKWLFCKTLLKIQITFLFEYIFKWN